MYCAEVMLSIHFYVILMIFMLVNMKEEIYNMLVGINSLATVMSWRLKKTPHIKIFLLCNCKACFVYVIRL